MKKSITRMFVIPMVLILTISALAGCSNNAGSDDDLQPYNYVIKREKPVIEAQEPVEGTAANFKVSKVFSDNMVLQRDEYIRIYGTADASDEGKIVTASFKGLHGSATVENGRWLITLGGTLPASKELGHSLIVSGADGVSYEFKDVLVGDVFWIVGQSNIQYNLGTMLAEQPDTGLELNKDDAIRVCINNPQSGKFNGSDATTVYEDCMLHARNAWQKAYNYAKSGSAIGYTFAKNIYDANNGEIPIGIITFECAGAALSAFMPPEVCEEKGIGLTQSKVLGESTTRWIWNQLMYPFRHMTISGLVWYQGESDCLNHLYPIYAENLAATFEFYRDTINQNYHDFPIFVVEFPSIYTVPAGTKGDWAFLNLGNIRGAISKVALLCDNVFMAAGSDVWKDKKYWNSLHPKCKFEQSKRLLDLALSVLYDKSDMEYSEGPVAINVKYASNKKSVTIIYRSVGDGLKYEGDKIIGFQIYTKGMWMDAEDVTIVDNNKIVIKYDYNISGVRYNCLAEDSYPEEVNLSNSSGIPAVAFYDIVE
ncbi:MAG: sialate O-acetylesterase [Clostridiaceae bacterium]|nr:sialate O-acetylesterase [Clostridiaceae bacterium]